MLMYTVLWLRMNSSKLEIDRVPLNYCLSEDALVGMGKYRRHSAGAARTKPSSCLRNCDHCTTYCRLIHCGCFSENAI